ncbi:MAG: SPOR domain-containing protein [Bacteroidota bacterium]
MNQSNVSKEGISTIFSPFAFSFALAISACLLLPSLTFGQGGYYHLIAGSYKNFKAASESAQSLKAKKYNPLILFPTGETNHFRISIYHSLDKQEVQGYVSQLKKAGINSKSFWILTQTDPTASITQGVARSNSKLAGSSGTGTGTNFHLISGTFKQFDNANQAVTALRTQGFEPYVIFPSTNNSSYRVSVYASNNRKEVESYSNMLKKRGKNPGWIYAEEPGVTTSLGAATIASNRITPGANINATTTYHLIGGSYQDFSQANEFSQKMLAKGFDPLIMFPEPGEGDRFRVSVYRSTNKNQVAVFQKNQERQKVLSKSWILAQ